MLNLRDPKIARYPTQTDATHGSPSSTEPPALTAVVMQDMTTFQTGIEEQPIGKFLRIGVVNIRANLYVALQVRLLGLCHRRENLCID